MEERMRGAVDFAEVVIVEERTVWMGYFMVFFDYFLYIKR